MRFHISGMPLALVGGLLLCACPAALPEPAPADAAALDDTTAADVESPADTAVPLDDALPDDVPPDDVPPDDVPPDDVLPDDVAPDDALPDDVGTPDDPDTQDAGAAQDTADVDALSDALDADDAPDVSTAPAPVKLCALVAERTARVEKQHFIQWTVLGGFLHQDFLPEGPFGFGVFSQALEQLLQAEGCVTDFDDYDKVIVVSPLLDLEFGGQAFANGRMGLKTHGSPFLMTHELLHTYGARDTYLNIGNRFQYGADLMGNYLNSPPVPLDGVAWTDVGLGDHNQSGVIDVYERAWYPEAIAIDEASLIVTEKQSAELTLRLSLVEGDVHFPIPLAVDSVSIPEQGLTLGGWYKAGDETVVVTFPAETEAALLTAGQLIIDVTREHVFTDALFERVTLSLDQQLIVPLTVQ